MIGTIVYFAFLAFVSFLMISVSRLWMKTGNLSATPSLKGSETFRSKHPIVFWFMVIPIFNAGVAIAILLVALLLSAAGIFDLLGFK